MKKKHIFLVLALVLVVLQFFQIDKTLPESEPSLDFVAVTNASGPQLEKFKAACYDCHSHETSYPWYTNIQPVGRWISGHIKHGRDKLNFSLWGQMNDDDRRHAIEEMQEEIEDKHMPLKSYMWTHPDGSLTEDDRVAMIAWLGTIAAGPLD